MSFFARRKLAFSLIEVVIALGVVSFCLVGILGLLSVAFNSSRHAGSDIAIILMATDVMSDLQLQSFDSVEQNIAGSGATYFFREDGSRLSSATGNEAPIYQCVVTGTADTATRTTNSSLLTITAVFSRYNTSSTNGRLATLPFFLARHD